MEHGKLWHPPDDLGAYRPGDAGGLESEWASTSRFLGVANKGVGTRGGRVEGKGPCACPRPSRKIAQKGFP